MYIYNLILLISHEFGAFFLPFYLFFFLGKLWKSLHNSFLSRSVQRPMNVIRKDMYSTKIFIIWHSSCSSSRLFEFSITHRGKNKWKFNEQTELNRLERNFYCLYGYLLYFIDSRIGRWKIPSGATLCRRWRRLNRFNKIVVDEVELRNPAKG